VVAAPLQSKRLVNPDRTGISWFAAKTAIIRHAVQA
jgi:hypothetical protein